MYSALATWCGICSWVMCDSCLVWKRRAGHDKEDMVGATGADGTKRRGGVSVGIEWNLSQTGAYRPILITSAAAVQRTNTHTESYNPRRTRHGTTALLADPFKLCLLLFGLLTQCIFSCGQGFFYRWHVCVCVSRMMCMCVFRWYNSVWRSPRNTFCICTFRSKARAISFVRLQTNNTQPVLLMMMSLGRCVF